MGIRVIVLLIFVLCFGCAKKKSDEIIGHWVSIDYLEGKRYQTLDFSDSSVFINKYGLYGYETYVIKNQNKYEVLGPHESIFFEVKNDTLQFINSDLYVLPFIRVINYSTPLKDDIFCDLPVSIDLPEATIESLIELKEKSLVAFINIGKLKKGYQSEKPQIKADSVLIQVNDVLASMTDLEEFIKYEKLKLIESDRERLILAINADRDTPSKRLDKLVQILQEFDPDLKIYLTYFDWSNRRFLYKRIRG